MATLPDADLRAIMGPDFKSKIEASLDVDANSTPEEHAASREQRASKLADLRFSCAAVVFTGCALIAGALYTKIGVGSVQGMFGSAFIALGVGSLIYITVKRASLLREAASTARA